MTVIPSVHVLNTVRCVSRLLLQRAETCVKRIELKYCEVTFLSDAHRHPKEIYLFQGSHACPACPSENICIKVKL